MKSKIVWTLLLGSAALFASETASTGGTDIVPRTVNFLIFAAILYYLAAEPIKKFFKERTQSIQTQLEEVEAKLKAAKEEKAQAEAELENAKKLAVEILDTAKKELEILTKEIKEQAKQEMEILEKSYLENMDLERRKRLRAVTKEVLQELFEEKALELDKEQFVNLIVKKVA